MNQCHGTFLLVASTFLLVHCGGSVVNALTKTDSGTQDGPASDGTSTGSDAGDCASVCQARATSCGEPASAAAASCAPFCAQSPNSSELSCIQSTSCADLATAFTQQHVVCGVPLDDAGVPDCQAVCMTKAISCGEMADGNAAAPDSGAAADCAGICAKSPTNSQLGCLQSSSCSDLATAFATDGTVCGIGTDGG
jgi:hypothetical protein